MKPTVNETPFHTPRCQCAGTHCGYRADRTRDESKKSTKVAPWK